MSLVKKWTPYGLLTILVALGFWLIFQPKVEDLARTQVRKELYNYNPNLCPGETIPFQMNDSYLRGLLEKGTKVQVRINWYACHPIERNDLVLFRYSEFEDPVIRRVVGIPSDRFQSVFQKKNRSWQLLINDFPVFAVKGEYFYGDDDVPLLALAEKDKRNVLGPDDVIIFSSFPPGHKDSGELGLVSIKDLVGKVEPLKK